MAEKGNYFTGKFNIDRNCSCAILPLGVTTLLHDCHYTSCDDMNNGIGTLAVLIHKLENLHTWVENFNNTARRSRMTCPLYDWTMSKKCVMCARMHAPFAPILLIPPPRLEVNRAYSVKVLELIWFYRPLGIPAVFLDFSSLPTGATTTRPHQREAGLTWSALLVMWPEPAGCETSDKL